MAGQQSRRTAWLMVALLFGFMLINFADKAIIGLAGVPIMKELGLTPKQFGLVGSSFFLLFSISAVVLGFAANRISTKWLLLGMGVLWACVQFPMIGPVTLPLLLGSRVILGAGEGPAYPVALHAIYKWFPNAERTLPTAVIGQGAAAGVVIAIPALQWVIDRYTWHAAFGALGLAGLVWVFAWLLLGKEGTLESPAYVEHRPARLVPYRRLILNPTTLSCFAVGFGAFWGQSLLLAWFTPYLIRGLGFSSSQAAWITTIPWAVSPLVSVAAAFTAQRLVLCGISTRVGRGLLGSVCVCAGGLAMLSMPFMASDWLKIAMVVIGFVLPAVFYVMGHPIVSEYTPARQRGAMIAINNAVATSAGIIAPVVMGSIVEGLGAAGYERAYAICGAICLTGGLLGIFFLRPDREHARLRSAMQPMAAE